MKWLNFRPPSLEIRTPLAGRILSRNASLLMDHSRRTFARGYLII